MRKLTSKYSLDDSLGHLASNASRAVLRRINQELARHGLDITPEQFSVIVHVWDQEGLPQYMLTSKLYKDKTNMARLVGSLEAAGFITRRPGQTDAREKIIYLTSEGRDVMIRISNLVGKILEVAQRGIDEQELRTCKDVLRRFHNNLL
jgi:DNA-binding MarR family transcriptional regulator